MSTGQGDPLAPPPERPAATEPGADAPEAEAAAGREAEEEPAGGGRLMENMPVVDLSGVRDRRDVAGLRVRNAAAVLVPQDIPDLLAGADCRNVAAIVPVPAGTRVESRIGEMEIAGEALAAGDANTILAIVGQAVVRGSVPAIGYRGVVLVGQIAIPRQAQGVLGGKILSQTGQIHYYDGEGAVRVFFDDTHFSRAFFDLLEGPETLVVFGDCSFAADVTPEVLRAKVRSMVLDGDVGVEDAALRPLLQFLATTLNGGIRVRRADDADS